MDAQTKPTEDLWFLKSSFPVYWPATEALTLAQDKFESYLVHLLQSRTGDEPASQEPKLDSGKDEDEKFTLIDAPFSSAAVGRATSAVREEFAKMDIQIPKLDGPVATDNDHPFMKGLLSHGDASAPPDMENKMLTDNADVTYQSTKEPLVDLFAELEDACSPNRVDELLNDAWKNDPLATLKIIFNGRSIHLGKASRVVFYRCAGWLAKNHPLTLVANLGWLSRPVIEKKAEEKKLDEGVDGDDLVLVAPEKDDDDPGRFDVKHGVAHGYWKDLLNMLALSARGKLDVHTEAEELRVIDNDSGKSNQTANPGQGEARYKRRELRARRHDAAVAAWEQRPIHRALHLTVARLFAEQLQADLALLRGDDQQARRRVSLCAKWAPSHERSHDKHTFIASSIAEIMHPENSISHLSLSKTENKKADREVYLRHAREAYRKDVSALRAQLDVVERDITAKTFSKIKYERIPSVAMKNYNTLFATKDTERFRKYLERVASGGANISGATLSPSTMVQKALSLPPHKPCDGSTADMQDQVLDLQWRSLVQRIKDSGTLDSCIAVCDVSGSMNSPRFSDGTCPRDSAIGLSLLVAEASAPPFGGAFITFSTIPAVERVDLAQRLSAKIRDLNQASWDMTTDLVAVFQDLILPMAVENKLTQEQMIRRIFVFSDMQFNSCIFGGREKWTSSLSRIRERYREAGYEMPQLVFWNLAGGRRGGKAPKPVTADEEGTALVTGYSQGLLKVFMDKGVFEEENGEGGEEEEDVEVKEDSDGDVAVVEKKAKKQKMDPFSVVKKAIGHKAYDMLKVMD